MINPEYNFIEYSFREFLYVCNIKVLLTIISKNQSNKLKHKLDKL